jgi:hypothetical protein
MYVETDCKITHNGKEFESGGAVVSDTYLIGYIKGECEKFGDKGCVTDWHGKKILGRYVVVSVWDTSRSYISSKMFAFHIVCDGKLYKGRGCGSGMAVKAKLSAKPTKGKQFRIS